MGETQLCKVKVVLPEVVVRKEKRSPDQLHYDKDETGQHGTPASGPGREFRPVNDLSDLERTWDLACALARKIRGRDPLRTTLKFSAGVTHGV
jgi:hypothetical protein